MRQIYLVALRPMKLLLILLALTITATAGEYVVLSNGFRIHADSHETDGALMRLKTSQGVIEIQSNSVSAIEAEEYTPPPPPVAASVPTPVESPAAAKDQRPLTTKEMVTQAAIKAGLPPEIVHSIARAESAYRTDAISPKGAIGVMQLMPGTAAGLNANPYDPMQNVEAGARYLRDLLVKYENDPHQVSKAIAAYNAGPGAVDKYNGVPPYRETVQYVNRVLKQYEKEQQKKKPNTTD
jgi:soluble lytic murein transglycosylase-like protein